MFNRIPTRPGIRQAGMLLPMIAVLSLPRVALSADWPQWRGPDRDGKSPETGLLQDWPEGGPELVWQVDGLGSGYGAPSVADGVIYLVVNDGLESESVMALSAEDGSRKWSTRIGKVGNPDQRPNYPAARSTPTIIGDAVYALGSDGDLVCLEASGGKIRWQKNMRTDFGGKPGEWAYAGSPLVDDDLVIAAPGGESAAVVAVRRDTGEVVWKAEVPGSEEAGYASIVVGELGEMKQYIAFLGFGLVGVDAKTGKFLWSYEGTSGTANSPTPVVRDGKVYSGAGRGAGGLVKLNPQPDAVSVEEVYVSPRLPTGQGGFILLGDYLYGSGRSTLMCVDFEKGETVWQERIPESASLCYADNRLYLHLEDGDVMLVEPSPEELLVRGQFSPPNQPEREKGDAWAYPVVANGRLYIRDVGTLWCYDISKD